MRSLAVHVSMRGLAAVLAIVASVTISGCDRNSAGISSETMVQSQAGSILVRCTDDDLATVVGWEPSPGYRGKVIVEGPSAEASISFESDTASDVRVALRCHEGSPRFEEFVQDDNSDVDGSVGGKG